jgi:hypothetical protein
MIFAMPTSLILAVPSLRQCHCKAHVRYMKSCQQLNGTCGTCWQDEHRWQRRGTRDWLAGEQDDPMHGRQGCTPPGQQDVWAFLQGAQWWKNKTFSSRDVAAGLASPGIVSWAAHEGCACRACSLPGHPTHQIKVDDAAGVEIRETPGRVQRNLQAAKMARDAMRLQRQGGRACARHTRDRL